MLPPPDRLDVPREESHETGRGKAQLKQEEVAPPARSSSWKHVVDAEMSLGLKTVGGARVLGRYSIHSCLIFCAIVFYFTRIAPKIVISTWLYWKSSL